MAVVVVGGNSRNIGKTTVVAGLISSLKEMRWTAFKITQHGHLLCEGQGKHCDCTTPDHTVAFTDETNRTSGKDSARYLLAGAVRSFLVRTRQGSLSEALPRLRAECAAAENAIIESNSVMEFLYPHLYLVVMDPGTSDFKASAKLYLERADAILWRAGVPGKRQVADSPDLQTIISAKPTFLITQPNYVSPELVSFVRERFKESAGHPSTQRKISSAQRTI